MKTTTYTTQVISPAKGKYLTQKDCDLLARVITDDKVYLAANDSPDNWKEIDEAEKQAYEQEYEATVKAQQEEEAAKAVEDAQAEEVTE